MKKTIWGMWAAAALTLSAVENDNAALNRDLQFRVQQCGITAQLQFTLANQKGPAVLPAPEIQDSAKCLSVNYQMPELSWKIRVVPRGKTLVAESELHNSGKTEQLLEPGLAFQFRSGVSFSGFWDGFGKTLEIGNVPIGRKGIKGALEKHVGASTSPFPASAVFQGERVFFLGTVPFDPLSYTAAQYDPQKNRLESSLRIVLAPGQTLKIRQVLGSITAPYGIPEGVVQTYYDSFPEVYAVSGGQDNPYIWGTHAHYMSWWRKPDRELSRRFHITIEWTYCPYRRSGELLCRDDRWDYKPSAPFRTQNMLGGELVNHARYSASEFRKLVKERFLKYGRNFGWMYYNSNGGTWCEVQLAEKYFPDSINGDTDGVRKYLENWSTIHDREVRMFPYGTSYAEEFERAQKILVRELDLPGFSFDCSYGGAYYRGPAVDKPLPGRAWDDRGKFIDQSIAINHQVDYVRSLRNNEGEPLSVFFNGNLKGDYAMTEASYVEKAQYKRWFPLLRWQIGPRPGTTHKHGFCIRQVQPDWRNLTREAFLDLVGRLSDHLILNQFQYGLANDQLSMFGNPQMIYVQPEALELMRSLWQAELPVKTEFDGKVRYLSRYGTGANTFFCFGNSSRNDVSGKVRIDNGRLTREGESVLFVRKMRDQAVTENIVSGGFTQFKLNVPSRTPVIYEAAASLKMPDGKVRVSSKKSLDRIVFTFEPEKAIDSKIHFRDIYGFRIGSVDVDGKPVAYTGNRAEIKIPAGGKLSVAYMSREYQLSEADLKKFSFTDPLGRPVFRIQAVPGAENVAERFNEYFRFAEKYQGGVTMKNDIPVTVLETPVPAAETVTLLIGGTPGIRMVDNGGIVIAAENAHQLDRRATQFFYALDRQYPVKIPFRSVMGLLQNIVTHFNLSKTVLPCRPYFEGDGK